MTGPVNGLGPGGADMALAPETRPVGKARRSMIRHLDAANAALAAALDDLREMSFGGGGETANNGVLAGASAAVVAGADAARKALEMVDDADWLIGHLRARMGDGPSEPLPLAEEAEIAPFGSQPLAMHLDDALRVRAAMPGAVWADRYLEDAVDAAAARLRGDVEEAG